MKYYLDFEFIEGFHKPLFGKRRHFIDLISVGLIAEDGREYYAISTDFNPKDANTWVKENVISKLPSKTFNGSNIHEAKLWKSNKTIADDILKFVNPHMDGDKYYDTLEDAAFLEAHNIKGFNPDEQCPYFTWRAQPEFYGYFSAYDWVLFCSLFGRMIDLPKGFPMYCRDLKHMLDEKLDYKYMTHLPRVEKKQPEINSNNNIPLKNKLVWAKSLPTYPAAINEHNALDDAKWNKVLHEFINTL